MSDTQDRMTPRRLRKRLEESEGDLVLQLMMISTSDPVLQHLHSAWEGHMSAQVLKPIVEANNPPEHVHMIEAIRQAMLKAEEAFELAIIAACEAHNIRHFCQCVHCKSGRQCQNAHLS